MQRAGIRVRRKPVIQLRPRSTRRTPSVYRRPAQTENEFFSAQSANSGSNKNNESNYGTAPSNSNNSPAARAKARAWFYGYAQTNPANAARLFPTFTKNTGNRVTISPNRNWIKNGGPTGWGDMSNQSKQNLANVWVAQGRPSPLSNTQRAAMHKERMQRRSLREKVLAAAHAVRNAAYNRAIKMKKGGAAAAKAAQAAYNEARRTLTSRAGTVKVRATREAVRVASQAAAEAKRRAPAMATAAPRTAGAIAGVIGVPWLLQKRPTLITNIAGSKNSWNSSNFVKLMSQISRIVGPGVIEYVVKSVRNANAPGVSNAIANFKTKLTNYSNSNTANTRAAFKDSIYKLIAVLVGYTNANSPQEFAKLVNISKELHQISKSNSPINKNRQIRLGANFTKTLRSLIVKFSKLPSRPRRNGTPSTNRLKNAKNSLLKSTISELGYGGAQLAGMNNRNGELLRELADLVYREYKDPRYAPILKNLISTATPAGRTRYAAAQAGYPLTGAWLSAAMFPSVPRATSAALSTWPNLKKSLARALGRSVVNVDKNLRAEWERARNNWMQRHNPNKNLNKYFNSVKRGTNINTVVRNMFTDPQIKNRNFKNTGNWLMGKRWVRALDPKEIALLTAFQNQKRKNAAAARRQAQGPVPNIASLMSHTWEGTPEQLSAALS